MKPRRDPRGASWKTVAFELLLSAALAAAICLTLAAGLLGGERVFMYLRY
jgi:hypothetical protein